MMRKLKGLTTDELINERLFEVLAKSGISKGDWYRLNEARDIVKKVNENLRRKNSPVRYEVLLNSDPRRVRKSDGG